MGKDTGRNSGRRNSGRGDGSPSSPAGVYTNNDDGDGEEGYVDDDEKPEPAVAIIDRSSVSTFFAVAVLVNSVFIGLDTQLRASQAGAAATTFMQMAEFVFLIIFTTELFMRIAADRCPKFWYGGWNIIDLVLVTSSAFDIVMAQMLGGEGGDVQKLRLVRMLKAFRLVRAMRIFRVLRFRWITRLMRGLIVLVKAIVTALKALGWVLLMFTLLNYLCAIITTEFLGLANDNDDPYIKRWFGDLFSSMFTMVQIATFQDWAYVTRHVGKEYGILWILFFTVYALISNLIILNVVLATLIENVISLNEEVKEARAGDHDGVEDWMLTPPESEESEDEEEAEERKRKEEEDRKRQEEAQKQVQQQSITDRLAMQSLSEFFDLAATYVGVEGVNQRKLVTVAGLTDALIRDDVKGKVFQVCPAMRSVEPHEMSERIWAACTRRQDRDGLSRQELSEACMTVRGELSLNHFCVINQKLTELERHVDHELVHLNKHQRKMNRRFLKMRHRLRKVYHFDGAPRKMVEMVNEMKRKNIQSTAEAAARGAPANASASPAGGGGADDGADDEESSASEKDW